MQLSRIAIFGPGLIGGSLALAARSRRAGSRLSVWSRDPQELAAARLAGIVTDDDLVTGDPAEAVAGAELVLLCVPPGALPELAERIAPHLEPGAAVSDVASIKDGLARTLGDIFRPAATARSATGAGSRYVGAHPMAGGERSGPGAARADLFDGAVCLLTPDAGTAPDALVIVENFWGTVGAWVRHMTPAAHDESVALVSHLPHVLAAALVHYVAAEPGEAAVCQGPGWRDVTRIAAGSPDLWTEILSGNRQPVTKALHGMIAKLREVLGYLEEGRERELQKFLSEARSQRETSPQRPPPPKDS